MPSESNHTLAGLCVPQFRSLVPRGGQDGTTIFAEDSTSDPEGMSWKRAKELTGLCIPEFGGIIVGAGKDPAAIGAEGYCSESLGMT